MGIDVIVIGHVVLVIGVGVKYRIQIQRVDAQRLQVVELPAQADEVTPVAAVEDG